MNRVERWFRELTKRRIRRGSFESVPELIAAIEEYLAASNDDPKPFVWQASVAAILERVAHCTSLYETLDKSIGCPFDTGHYILAMDTESIPLLLEHSTALLIGRFRATTSANPSNRMHLLTKGVRTPRVRRCMLQ
jgi:hypothetical protein